MRQRAASGDPAGQRCLRFRAGTCSWGKEWNVWLRTGDWNKGLYPGISGYHSAVLVLLTWWFWATPVLTPKALFLPTVLCFFVSSDPFWDLSCVSFTVWERQRKSILAYVLVYRVIFLSQKYSSWAVGDSGLHLHQMCGFADLHFHQEGERCHPWLSEQKQKDVASSCSNDLRTQE